MVTASTISTLDRAIDTACRRIPPLWPLSGFVAVNPYQGLSSLPFWEADRLLKRVNGTGLCMPREYYRACFEEGRIREEDVAQALAELGLSDWNVTDTCQRIHAKSVPPRRSVCLVTDLLDADNRKDWSGFVLDQISHYCAAYFDERQALWPLPWKEKGLFDGWRAYTEIDRSARIFGLRGVAAALHEIPSSPIEVAAWSLERLDVPTILLEDYFHALLMSVGGWAAWSRRRLWEAELAGKTDPLIRELLAIRLSWDTLLYVLEADERLRFTWRQILDTRRAEPTSSPTLEQVFQTAMEIGYRRRLVKILSGSKSVALSKSDPPNLQAVFCIDVRSEIYRSALEEQDAGIQTIGFAGFFGIPMAYRPLGARQAEAHLPVFMLPGCCVNEALRPDENLDEATLVRRRRLRQSFMRAWKLFKTSAASCFTFVESLGLFLYAPKLLLDGLGWTRPTKPPERAGLRVREYVRLRPTLTSTETSVHEFDQPCLGIPPNERVELASKMLQGMGLGAPWSRIVLLVGHASATANNPQSTSLDCGACAGHGGASSARVAAVLLNEEATREGLRKKGIDIPGWVKFVPALHETVTDTVRLLDVEDVPPSHLHDLERVQGWLASASREARRRRLAASQLAELGDRRIEKILVHRTRDWAETRPEWAQAGNAVFIAAPRVRTRGCSFEGRAFLHEYDWRKDEQFMTLRLIMTAPLLVANWINLQYYGSMVDARRFGSGNKVLHNVVGGAIGVLEGNGGDLRIGLALQSLHDGTRWRHEPLRLHAVIEAPSEPLEEIISTHDELERLIVHEWLWLYRLAEQGLLFRYRPAGGWVAESDV